MNRSAAVLKSRQIITPSTCVKMTRKWRSCVGPDNTHVISGIDIDRFPEYLPNGVGFVLNDRFVQQ